MHKISAKLVQQDFNKIISQSLLKRTNTKFPLYFIWQPVPQNYTADCE